MRLTSRPAMSILGDTNTEVYHAIMRKGLRTDAPQSAAVSCLPREPGPSARPIARLNSSTSPREDLLKRKAKGLKE